MDGWNYGRVWGWMISSLIINEHFDFSKFLLDKLSSNWFGFSITVCHRLKKTLVSLTHIFSYYFSSFFFANWVKRTCHHSYFMTTLLFPQCLVFHGKWRHWPPYFITVLSNKINTAVLYVGIFADHLHQFMFISEVIIFK